MILRFMTSVIGKKIHEIEVLVNIIYLYSLYVQFKWITDFGPMKWGGFVTTDA